ncbi:hypothetical protein [Heyndrickxia coagulans]|uniref:Uncharacterized protein n=1 Tax=Heyndrickxia coagulans DSM 1 = ATCC 7050 TaxID=1121088 RepID=A0A8B4BRG6_HEYCO|nr:hypothetical protein [Heyndrickxia coagulans]AJH79246.1 putative membrane protein [Heyndrickxia coagulans DSM 1 = ATCC 7050]MCR2845418.1 hypothetical protein [Heyndrickxia coagulans]MDR4223119.1 hypothetical protein [Heyndrickxia coagulans DSM 1 = ATCC 7050]MED4494643.1 hypothetical protein [Heyndrickxia coagulans]MED4535740.1 hypothetical protein [Heyndrickxia coagulans]
MKKLAPLEAIVWNIALPGFAQLLAGRYVKGIAFIFMEFLINVNSRFNEAIMLSFLGKTMEAGNIIDYGWLMFYPCLYFFAMWDAYKMACGNLKPYSYLPFVFAAYFVTIGLMLSPAVIVREKMPGPVFFPMFCAIPGLLAGGLLRKILTRKSHENS